MEEKINIFGSSYGEIGSSDSNLILKTAGRIKIQMGRKFIDLIDDKGNINSGYSNIIKKVDSVDNIGGTGIFYVDGNIIVSIDGLKIALTTESGTNYVSFIEKQNISRDLQIIAQKNIGFIYDSLDDIGNINSGIIYIESEKSLYIVNEGDIQKYLIEIPNPYKKQFIISKDDENNGSLLITGKGIENSLAFDALFIYNTQQFSNFKSDYPIVFTVNDASTLEIYDNKVTTNNILSKNADSYSGYRLYFDGESTLEVDNLIVRNGIPSSSSTNIDVIPLEYYKDENVILKISLKLENNNSYYEIELKYDSVYTINDILSSYILVETLSESEESEEKEVLRKLLLIKFKVIGVSSSNTISVILETNYDINLDNCINKIIGIINEDLVIGKIGNKYNLKEHGIISKLNIFYSAKFDKEGEGELTYPYYSQELYNELSSNIENYTYVIPPIGIIKKLELVHFAEYERENKKIYFKDYSGNNLFNIDATDFIKDGMVSSVDIDNRIIEGLEVECLVIVFNEDSGLEEINIPLSRIFDSGLYYTKTEIDELLEEIPTQLLADWNESDNTQLDFIKNKPEVYTKEEIDDIVEDITSGIPTQLQADWNESDTDSKAYIKNKPTIPDEQILSDWNQTDALKKDYIKNKPDVYTKDEIDNKLGDLMPMGSIIMWAYNNIPSGWHICDGTVLSGDEYSDFINTLGPTLPDLRCRFVVGINNNLGQTSVISSESLFVFRGVGGERTHTLTIDEMPRHNHTKLVRIGNENNWVYGDDKVSNTGDGYLTLDQSTFSVGYTGGNYPHNNLPPYYALFYIIKIKK